MTRFNVAASVSLAILAAACVDSATGVPSLSHAPTSASFAGNPPPPPLTGSDAEGFLEPFSEDFAAVRTNASPGNPCGPLAGVSIHYSWNYLINKTDNSQWAHLNIDGQNRMVTMHQTPNKLDANGEIVGPGYVFKITDVVSGNFDQLFYDLTVNGIVTLSDGTKCNATADLSGSLGGESSGN